MVSVLKGIHIHTTFFMGDGETLANVGKLVQRVGEWQTLSAAILLGAKQMRGNLEVICEGDPEVVRQLANSNEV